MKELRFHGRGGQGVVKAAQTIVQTVVDCGSYAHFIPFFGVERKGSPVYGFLRLDDKNIRLKTQVYEPDVLMIFDDTLLGMKQTYEGLKPDSIVIINTNKTAADLILPPASGAIYTVDATRIAQEAFGKNIPNTAMLGAFAKATGLVDWQALQDHIVVNFGEVNRQAAQTAYNQVASLAVQEEEK